jgi:hypothetical protein
MVFAHRTARDTLLAGRRRSKFAAFFSTLVISTIAALTTLSSATSPAAEQARRKVALPGPSDVTPVLRSVPAARKPADYRSAHFLIHTDLTSKDARELLNRLESMLALVAKYWGQPPSGVIECYVVEDLNRWPEGALDPGGRAKIQQEAGVTMVQTLNQGPRTVAAKAVVYASSKWGNPQHEAVHAYCGQTFGHMGPLWYSEGMAEMGQYWRHNDPGVHCHAYVIEYIRNGPPKPLAEILSDRSAAFSGDSWQNYAWRWALCHLLENNPNYSARFRMLGTGFLSGQKTSFGEMFGSMLPEIGFEYRQFVRHLDEDYRVDLCSWDWKHKFRAPVDTPAVTKVIAPRGWQPSGAAVTAGDKYRYRATGTWQIVKSGSELSADGDDEGDGRLEGVIFDDYALGEPFSLGADGTFKAPSDGRLYLRCHDAWNRLADNKGTMNVTLQKVGSSERGEAKRETASDAAAE